MKVLVTGATGFVGSQLTAELVRRGHQVRVLRRASSRTLMLADLPDLEHILGDILELDAVAQAVRGCDLVFHVAALSSYWRAQRDHVYRVNVDGTRVVMDACLRAGVPRVVHTSSVAAIGVRRDGLPADENTSFDAFSARWVYADSKHRAEQVVYRAIDRGLNAVIVNPAAVIGPGDHNLISSSMVLEFAKRPIPAVPSGGVCLVDIDAVVQGHLAAAERGRTGERYILGGENLTNLEAAATICALTGQPPPRLIIPGWLLGPAALAVDMFNRVTPRPPVVSGEQLRLVANNIYYDSSKAVRELGLPLLPFRGAAERAYRWYLEHGYLR